MPRHLDVISRAPAGTPHPVPLLFVHGAFINAWYWDKHFLPYFAQKGYSAHALSLSGHGGSEGRAELDELKIADYVRDVLRVADELPAPPVLIGHSMGGFVVQKALEHARFPGAILLCPVPPHGLAPSAFGMMLERPDTMKAMSEAITGHAPDIEGARSGLFQQPIEDADVAEFLAHCQPESLRALWDMTAFDLPHPQRRTRPPMLILGAAQDRLITPTEVRSAATAWGVEAEIFEDFGHVVMLEQQWRTVADRIDAWLTQTLPRGEASRP